MTGVLISILVTWAMLYFTNQWLLSIVIGFIAWFVSAVIIFEAVEFITHLRRENMAGRPKDPTINHKIFNELDRMLATTHFRDITIDQISENTGVSKATIYRRWKDKSSIIVDMFVSRTQIFENENKDLHTGLYQF